MDLVKKKRIHLDSALKINHLLKNITLMNLEKTLTYVSEVNAKLFVNLNLILIRITYGDFFVRIHYDMEKSSH